jgi:hypothetical protein
MVGASTRAFQLPSVHTPQSHTQDLRIAILPLSLGQTSVRIPESPSFPPTSSARRLFPWRVERRGQWVKSVAGRILMLRILASSAARLSTPADPFGGRSVATPQDTTLIAADTTNVAGPKARSFIIGMPPRQCTMSLEWVDDSCSNRWWQVETRSDHPLSSQGLPTFVYGAQFGRLMMHPATRDLHHSDLWFHPRLQGFRIPALLFVKSFPPGAAS